MARLNWKPQWSKKKKRLVFGIACLVVIFLGYLLTASLTGQKETSQLKTVTVKKGSLVASTILSGKAASVSEQYVYYDSTKGADPYIMVSVGDYVSVGQALVQYDSTSAQVDYDAAQRSLNQANQAIRDFERDNADTYGTTEYENQLQQLYNTYADVQGTYTKAQEALNATTVTSTVSGTVVDVTYNVNPSSQVSQPLVHIASQGQLQIKGTLTEFDIPNVHVGQTVTVKSKVYPDKEWTGTISYVSNYPNETSDSLQAADTGASAQGSTSASYDYTVDILDDTSDLRQGFSTSVEIHTSDNNLLVPLSAVVHKDKKSYVWLYDSATGEVKRRQVSLGQADAKHQEILKGLEKGQRVIENPTSDLSDGQKVSDLVTEN